MRTSAVAAVRLRRRQFVLLAMIAGAFAAGGLASWLARPKFLLSDVRQTHVRKLESAHDQLVLAKISGSEDWLKSVEKFWPDAEREIQLADQDLARRYLYQDRQPEAMTLFAKFAALDDPDLRAFGLAGECVVLARQGRYQESAELLGELWPLHEKLDSTMKQLILIALQKDQQASRREMGRETEAMLKRWRESEIELPDEPVGG
jgi:hypothetical protein